jgi:hypothetical protein
MSVTSLPTDYALTFTPGAPFPVAAIMHDPAADENRQPAKWFGGPPVINGCRTASLKPFRRDQTAAMHRQE